MRDLLFTPLTRRHFGPQGPALFPQRSYRVHAMANMNLHPDQPGYDRTLKPSKIFIGTEGSGPALARNLKRCTG